MLEAQVHDRPGYKILKLVGELDTSTVSICREWFAAVSCTERLVIDLSRVPFIDSAGVGALIGGVRRLREQGGEVAVACGRSSIAGALHTIRLDDLVPVADGIDDAAAELRSDQDQPVTAIGP
jgi:anti-sigma B factor antagonist